MNYLRIVAALILIFTATATEANSLSIKGNRITLNGERGEILYRDSGDLDRDGRIETVFSAWFENPDLSIVPKLVVTRQINGKWNLITTEEAFFDMRTDVTDINGDHKLEIVARGLSGDGHGLCSIYRLDKGKLVQIAHFYQTRFKDLTGDGIPKVLSVSMVSFGFIGDHWLIIYKWNGKGYTDVSCRFPREYDAVIRDLKLEIYRLQYTNYHGSRSNISENPDMFADLYYYLGLAYEFRGLPDKAREQYAIAYRLEPTDEDVAAAFRRMWKKNAVTDHQ